MGSFRTAKEEIYHRINEVGVRFFQHILERQDPDYPNS
jgi:hypothetical protein